MAPSTGTDNNSWNVLPRSIAREQYGAEGFRAGVLYRREPWCHALNLSYRHVDHPLDTADRHYHTSHGLMSFILQPDYIMEPQELAVYKALLEILSRRGLSRTPTTGESKGRAKSVPA
jgi:hypothetical protein